MSSAARAAAARGALLSIALRLLSFLLSQLTVRAVSAAALGQASIRLELLLSTALFVGREGFRLALTKEAGGGGADDGENCDDAKAGPGSEQRIANVAWLSVPVGALLSAAALAVHLHQCNQKGISEQESLQSASAMLDYKVAGMLYCLAAFVESLSEPLVIRCLQQMEVAAKAKAEGAALVVKSASCFGCLYLTRCGWVVGRLEGVLGSAEMDAGANFAVTAFGVSQLVYASIFTVVMYRNARSSDEGIRWPKKVKRPAASNPYRENSGDKDATMNDGLAFAASFDLHTLHLVLVFALQGLFKHALTEADKIVLSALAGSYDQGVYALAASYGGLAARLLLQPVEENARLLFSRQGAAVAQCASKSRNGESKETEKKEKDVQPASMSALVELEETYFFLIRVVLYVGLLFATVASNYTSILLRVLAGNWWGTNAEASAALSAFCVYTAFLALNGITEAFVYGVARSGNDVGKLGMAHAVVGGIFALTAPGLVSRRGAVGLVAANCLSMGLRSMYSLFYARGYFEKAGKRRSIVGVFHCILPHAVVLAAFGLSFLATKSSRMLLYDARVAAGGSWTVAGAQHVCVGILCVILTAALALGRDKDVSDAVVKWLKRKKD